MGKRNTSRYMDYILVSGQANPFTMKLYKRRFKNGLNCLRRRGGRKLNMERKKRSSLRMRPRELVFTSERYWLMTSKLNRFTLDIDYSDVLSLLVSLNRLEGLSVEVVKVERSPSQRGWHVVGVSPYGEPTSHDRIYAGDDPLRATLDNRRPRYATQVLFHTKGAIWRKRTGNPT